MLADVKAWVVAHINVDDDRLYQLAQVVLASTWGRRLTSRAMMPPRGGVVLSTILDVEHLPTHFFNRFMLQFLVKVGPFQAIVVRGVYFGRTLQSQVTEGLCNFVIMAYNEENFTWHALVSKRPFTDGGRHKFFDKLVMTDVRARRRWTHRVLPHARAVGRMAIVCKLLFEDILRPGGPAFKRARNHFDAHRYGVHTAVSELE